MRMTLKQQQEQNDHKAKAQQIELELNAILEITQAINNNVPEESLYMMYKFTLRGNLNISRMALYVLDEIWECKVHFGTKQDISTNLEDLESLKDIKDITSVKEINFQNEAFQQFDLVIPVLHKNRILSYVFVSQYQAGRELYKEEIDNRFVQALSNIILVAIENKKLVRRQISQEAYKKEMEIAQKVQSHLFPRKLPNTDKLKVKATYFPHDLIGGDYYDYISIDEDKFLICIADVSGKGIPAALLMSNFQASLRTLIRQTENLEQIVEELNYSIYQNAQGDHFITFLIALYDEKAKTLQYINAGHSPAYFYDYQQKKSSLLNKGTTVLGIFSPLPFLEKTIISNLNGFFLFAYTDGVTEIENPDEEQFGLERLIPFLESRRKKELSEIHGNLITRINNFKKGQKYTDDITLLSCRIDPK